MARETTHQDAYNEGRDALYSFRDLRNPYELGSVLWRCWELGWGDAWKEYNEE